MNALRTTPLILLACLPLLGACQKSTPPAPTETADVPTTALGKAVEEATRQAREKLANEPITLSSDSDTAPKAEISPSGDLLINGTAVAINEQQRALLLEHRRNIVAIAETGMTIGVRGADLGMKAAGEALKGVFSGNTEDIGRQIEAEAEKLKADAVVICNRLPAALESQRKLADAVPEFEPYATMSASDIDECMDGTQRHGATSQEPSPDVVPPQG